MPTSTYVPLAQVTLASSALGVTFSSIDQSYRDLVVSVTGTGTGSMQIRFNNDSNSNYNYVALYGNTSSAATYVGQFTSFFVGTLTTTPVGMVTEIMDYSVTDKHKIALSQYDRATNRSEIKVTRWADTSAITQIDLLNVTFDAGAVVTLYGIAG